MCGIIGHIQKQEKIDLELFNAMRDTLLHRGPDGAGTQLLNTNKVAFGHRRLSIIDLSEKGKQPMCNEDQTIWLTFNGEIYNFKKLKKLLQSNGHIFSSKTDSEVLIHGYEEWGMEGLLIRLKGMFVFAIWDETKKRLFAARDRFGIKPFYYYQDVSQFIFASEIKAIIKNPTVDTTLDFSAVADFLVYRFIPAPKSVYQNIKKLPSAHYLIFDGKFNQYSVHKYWDLEYSEQTSLSYPEVLEKTNDLLQTAVKEHLVSDVPIGVFLSGGYDSSAIVHYLNQMSHATQTFSIGFEGSQRSEHEYAQIVADRYNTSHFEKILPPGLRKDISNLSYFYDEPLGGSSFIPTFEVSKLAAKQVKVVLGGDGGDEVFAGYNWYYQLMDSTYSFIDRVKFLLHGKEDLLTGYRKKMDWAGFSYKEAARLLNGNLSKSELPSTNWIYEKYDRPKLPKLKRLQLLDFKTFLPELILTKVDRAGMANSLEVRVPFLDHELIEFVFSLPTESYYQKGIKKKLLYSLIKQHFPQKILNKKKQGFSYPSTKPIDYSALITEGFMIKNNIVSLDMVKKYIRDNQSQKLFALAILENWFSYWKG